jgi:RNA polymerase sigma factor (sigma-70 family)
VNNVTDQQLLRDYAGKKSETAFTELVRRHIDFVYSVALRMVCDVHLAQDVTQGVFLALAQNAGTLTEHPVLSGWLHRTARNLAANTVRSETRRHIREQEAAAMNQLPESDTTWEIIAPHLDEALGELAEQDRDALLLRYFERKSSRDMADILGTSEDAAKKRVSRAMERLREMFSKRRVTIGAGGLAVLISANAVQSAPVELRVIISASMAKTAIGVGTAAKGLAAAKIGTTLGSAGAFIPMLGSFYFLFKANLAEAKSPQEHCLMFRFYLVQSLLAVILICLTVGFLRPVRLK